jgi:hypothetical protein
MARYAVTAIVEAPRVFATMIPRKLALELEKPKYRRLGITLESVEIEGLKE